MRYLIALLALAACCPIDLAGSPCTAEDTASCISPSARLGCGADSRWEIVNCGTSLSGTGCNDWTSATGNPKSGAECRIGDLPEGARCAWLFMHISISECAPDRLSRATCVDGVIHRVTCEMCPGKCPAQ